MADRRPTEVSHLAQLRKGFMALDRKKDERLLRELLAQAEHFVFTAVPEADDEIKASVEAMREAGVWHLPYPVCTFEFNGRLTMDGEVKSACERLIMLCVERDGHEPLAPYFFLRSHAHRHRWVGISYRHGDDAQPDDEASIEVAVEIGTVKVSGARSITTGQTLQDALAACIVALATKGIRRERWIGDKKVLVGRKEPRDAYTRVMIAETIGNGDGSATPGERHKVRLHLRRAHNRDQPHGPGRKYVRTIHIAAQLIGYAEEGRITHDHYEHYPAEAHP